MHGHVVTLNIDNGIPGAEIWGIVEDELGFLWITVGSGIIRISANELDKAFDTPSYRPNYSLFTTFDGAAGTPLWKGTASAVAGRDGRLWFVTGGGVTVVAVDI